MIDIIIMEAICMMIFIIWSLGAFLSMIMMCILYLIQGMIGIPYKPTNYEIIKYFVFSWYGVFYFAEKINN